jgi:thiamine biosynthesis protein ThiS
LNEEKLHIHVNGETREVAAGTSLQNLVAQLELAPERLAIELNRAVVRRKAWPDTHLSEGDRVEIVHFVGGGCREVGGQP